MPRDLLIVVGDTIVEAPLSWRCRHHEVDAYRPLIKSYFRQGAGWLQAPRPQLTDELFPADHQFDLGGYAITEFESVFDAADFVRFGRDIVVQNSHVTNDFGIDWMQRALGSTYRIHRVAVNDPHAMHIDATIVPLAPGKLLVIRSATCTMTCFVDGRSWRRPNRLSRLTGPCIFAALG